MYAFLERHLEEVLAGICVSIHYEALHFLHRRALVPGNHRWLMRNADDGSLT